MLTDGQMGRESFDVGAYSTLDLQGWQKAL